MKSDLGKSHLLESVKQAASDSGLTLVELATAIGERQVNFYNVLHGRSQKRLARTLAKIREELKLPDSWPTPASNVIKLPMAKVPIVGAAESGRGADDDFDDAIYAPANMVTAGSLGLVNRGDSNMPLIHPGDVLIAEPTRDPRSNRLMFVRRPDGTISAKFVKFQSGQFLLCSANKRYEPEPAECEWIGLVTGLYRQEGVRQLMLVDSMGLSEESFGWHS